MAMGVMLAVIGGTIISKPRLEQYVEPFVFRNKMLDLEQAELTTGQRLEFALDQVGDIIKKVWLYVLIGVGIRAAIHNWIPRPLSLPCWAGQVVLGPLASLVGAPMYADIFGTLPIAALVAKG